MTPPLLGALPGTPTPVGSGLLPTQSTTAGLRAAKTRMVHLAGGNREMHRCRAYHVRHGSGQGGQQDHGDGRVLVVYCSGHRLPGNSAQQAAEDEVGATPVAKQRDAVAARKGG